MKYFKGWGAGYTNLKTSMNSDPQYTRQSQAEPRTLVTPKLGRRREPEGSSQALGSGRDPESKKTSSGELVEEDV